MFHHLNKQRCPSVPNQLYSPLTDKYVWLYYVVGINEFCFSVIKWADVIMYLNLI